MVIGKKDETTDNCAFSEKEVYTNVDIDKSLVNDKVLCFIKDDLTCPTAGTKFFLL